MLNLQVIHRVRIWSLWSGKRLKKKTRRKFELTGPFLLALLHFYFMWYARVFSTIKQIQRKPYLVQMDDSLTGGMFFYVEGTDLGDENILKYANF